MLKYVISYNKTHAECRMKVQVNKLCGDVENFASICAEAKARERNRISKPTPKQEALHAFCGIAPEPRGNCVPASEVLAKLREIRY